MHDQHHEHDEQDLHDLHESRRRPPDPSLSRPFHGSEVDDEIEFHFAETIEHLIDEGWPPASARAEAELRFGDRRRHPRNLTDINRSLQRRHTRLAMWDAIRQNVRDPATALQKE